MPSRRAQPFTLDALEPRTLLAAAPITFTDGDGTAVRITLAGNGNMALLADGGTFDLQLTGTDQGTRVTITTRGGTDGRATLDDITADGAIKSITGKTLDLTGDVSINGSVTTLTLGHFTGGGDRTITIGGTSAAKPASLSLGRVSDLSVTSGTKLKSLKVLDWEDTDGNDLISAPALAALDSKEDLHVGLRLESSNQEAPLGKVTVKNALGGQWFIDGDAASIKAGSIAGSFLANIRGTLGTIESKGDLSGVVAAASIGKISAGGDLDNATLLAGADLGDDGEFGGAGEDQDLFFRGTIGGVAVKGQVIDSILGAGLDPNNGTLGDGDDFVTGKERSTIGTVKVTGTSDNDSRFAAGAFRSVRVGGTKVDPAGDPRFLLASTDPDEDPPVIQAELANDTGDPDDGVTSDPAIEGRVTDLGRIASFRVGVDDAELAGFSNILALLEPSGRFELSRARIEQINGGPLSAGVHTINLVARDEVGNTAAIFTVTFTFQP